MSDEKRRYRMRRRAEAEQRTRLRITESAVELHGTVGPARTSISAIARRAGVRRSTVYRHFPDDASLFSACSSHWLAGNPFPDLARWASIGDPAARLPDALQELYTYYRRTRRMIGNILRDQATMPAVRRTAQGYRDYLTAARTTLMNGRNIRGRARRRVSAAVGHALTFATWNSLADGEGLTDKLAADLMCRLVAAVGEPAGVERRRRG